MSWLTVCSCIYTALITTYSIDGSGVRNRILRDDLITTANSFECLLYDNPTQRNIEEVPASLHWRLNLDTMEELIFSETYSDDYYLVSIDGNAMQIVVLGGFSGSVYGDQFVRFFVATERKLRYYLNMQCMS